MVPYIPLCTKILQNSLIYFIVYFVRVAILCLLGTHYSLICIVKISDLRNKNNCVISIIVTNTYRLSTVKLGPSDVPEPTRYGKVPLPTDN